jgi:GNAT superfamily N-acetyltransferase
MPVSMAPTCITVASRPAVDVRDDALKMAVLTPAEWPTLMAVRLRALEDSPESFLSDYDSEKKWGRDEWMQRFDDAVWVIARDGDDVVGIARSVRLPDKPLQERYVESVWVAPFYRGSGVTGDLLNALVDAEPSTDIKELWLWLLDSNHQARRTYQNLGFTPTDDEQELRDGSGRYEERWIVAVKDLRRS